MALLTLNGLPLSVIILCDFNSRLVRGDKDFTGPFIPHARMDDGGVLMKEIMSEYQLRAANTHFQPSRTAARSTGAATYCQDKAYIQPANAPYRADQAPSTIQIHQTQSDRSSRLSSQHFEALNSPHWRKMIAICSSSLGLAATVSPEPRVCAT